LLNIAFQLDACFTLQILEETIEMQLTVAALNDSGGNASCRLCSSEGRVWWPHVMLNERGRHHNRFGCMCNFIFIHSSPSSINIGVVAGGRGGAVLRAGSRYNVCVNQLETVYMRQNFTDLARKVHCPVDP
jgi:hypothetical protein